MLIYGDFSTIVQLGIGLHLGTAALELFGRFDVAPITRRLDRLGRLIERKSNLHNNETLSKTTQIIDFESLDDNYQTINDDINIFHIRLENEYKIRAIINTANALILIFILIMLSFWYNITVEWPAGIFFIVISILPAFLTVLHLRIKIWMELKNIKRRIKFIEEQLL